MRNDDMDVTLPMDLPADYPDFLADVKRRIQTAQIKAAMAVTHELIQLYWEIGQQIVERQQREQWGTGVINRLATDLQRAFPGMKGFSSRNIWRMRQFYLTYAEKGAILPQVVAQIPWGHNVLLLERIKDMKVRLWYAQQAVTHGWSRAVLWHHIDTHLYERQATAEKATNFAQALPQPQSDLAHEILKDPYTFDFLTLDQEAHERDIERGLITHIRDFLVELGAGFAFVGNQYHLTVGDEDFYLDLLFYHLRLRCFVVVDLKARTFRPEDAGKMNFYLSAVDDRLRHPDDQPSIGLILCKTRDKLMVEYALRNMATPIGVIAYELTEALPEHLRGSLPTIADLEAELGGVESEEE